VNAMLLTSSQAVLQMHEARKIAGYTRSTKKMKLLIATVQKVTDRLETKTRARK